MRITEHVFSIIFIAILGYVAYAYLKGREERRKLRQRQDQIQFRINNDVAVKVRAIGVLTAGIDAVLMHIAKDDTITNEGSIIAAANALVDSFYFSWLRTHGHHFYLSMTRVRIIGVYNRIALYELPEELNNFLQTNVR